MKTLSYFSALAVHERKTVYTKNTTDVEFCSIIKDGLAKPTGRVGNQHHISKFDLQHTTGSMKWLMVIKNKSQ